MPNRGSAGSYRYGFNGKEKLDELHSNNGDSYDFGARIYDARIARWLSCDPRESEYPWQSTYAYYKNSPISIIDVDGMGGPDLPGENARTTEVKAGEGPSQVSQRTGVSMEQIAAYNPSVFPQGLKQGTYMLKPGQLLNVEPPDLKYVNFITEYGSAGVRIKRIGVVPEVFEQAKLEAAEHNANVILAYSDRLFNGIQMKVQETQAMQNHQKAELELMKKYVAEEKTKAVQEGVQTMIEGLGLGYSLYWFAPTFTKPGGQGFKGTSRYSVTVGRSASMNGARWKNMSVNFGQSKFFGSTNPYRTLGRLGSKLTYAAVLYETYKTGESLHRLYNYQFTSEKHSEFLQNYQNWKLQNGY